MLGIILFILKLIGILLLVILGVILLVLTLVLFVPVKYSGSGSKYGEVLKVQATVTYLNPIVRVIVQYPDACVVKVKICGFTVFSTGESDKSKEENIGEENFHEEAEKKEKHTFKNNPTAEQKCSHQASQESSETKEEGSPKSRSTDTEGEQFVSTENCSEKVQKQKAQSDPDDLEIRTGEERPKDSVLDTVGYYASLFQENKGLILEVMKTVLKALKTILPRKCRIKAVFGTGEADKTGFIYAAYCALDGYLPGEIILEPVWTEKFAEGEFELKGRIRFIHFLVAVVKIIANRNVRLLIKKIRRV